MCPMCPTCPETVLGASKRGYMGADMCPPSCPRNGDWGYVGYMGHVVRPIALRLIVEPQINSVSLLNPVQVVSRHLSVDSPAVALVRIQSVTLEV